MLITECGNPQPKAHVPLGFSKSSLVKDDNLTDKTVTYSVHECTTVASMCLRDRRFLSNEVVVLYKHPKENRDNDDINTSRILRSSIRFCSNLI